ncbi:MAG: hypothetical protein ACKOGA_24830, partial [Planctomycetaceae bacterium]
RCFRTRALRKQPAPSPVRSPPLRLSTEGGLVLGGSWLAGVALGLRDCSDECPRGERGRVIAWGAGSA